MIKKVYWIAIADWLKVIAMSNSPQYHSPMTSSSLNQIIGERRTYSDIACTHSHAYAQLLLPLRGTLFIETHSHRFELDPSCLFFLPPGCQHHFYSRSSNEFLVLDIPSFLVASGDWQPYSGGLCTELDDRWQALCLLLLSELNQTAQVQQNLMPLFQYGYGLLTQKRLPRSLQYIHNNLHQSLPLQQLAALEGYNLTYYCEWFKKLTGLSPKAYLQNLRLQKAKELLSQTDFSITEIALQVGYEHPASLTRLFQQLENLTPLAYRQQSRRWVKKNLKMG